MRLRRLRWAGRPKILLGKEPARWCAALDELLSDDPRRLRIGRAAQQRTNRFSLEKTFEGFWQEHVNAVEPPEPNEAEVAHAPWPQVKV